MKQKFLFALWGGLFILCAGCGFIPTPGGILSSLMMVCSLLFFLPPAVILYRAEKSKDRSTLQLVRNLSALSLLLTLVLLVVNFLSALGSELWGTVVYYILIIVSSPMVCSGYWALSLFLWACLLMASLKALKHK